MMLQRRYDNTLLILFVRELDDHSHVVPYHSLASLEKVCEYPTSYCELQRVSASLQWLPPQQIQPKAITINRRASLVVHYP